MLRPFSQRNGAQNEDIAPHKFVSEYAYLTKSGEVCMHLEVEGVDFECQTDTSMEQKHGRLLTAMLSLPEEVRISTYMLKLDSAELKPQELTSEIDRRTHQDRAKYLVEKAGLVTIKTYIVLTFEPETSFSIGGPRGQLKIKQRVLDKRLGLMSAAVRGLIESVGDLLEVTILGKEQIFSFLRLLASFDPEVAAMEPLQFDNNIDHWATSQFIKCYRDGICFDKMPVEVLTMRKRPANTCPNVLRELLSMPGNFLLCSQFKRKPTQKVLSTIETAQDHHYIAQWMKNIKSVIQMAISKGDRADIVKDAAATGRVKELALATKRIAKGEVMGQFSFTGIFFGKDAGKIEASVTQARKIIGNHQGSFVRETSWAYGAFLSIWPGTTLKHKERFRQREYLLPASQFVDLGFFYNHRAGNKRNPLTKRPALMVVETTDHTAYSFNLVPPGGNRKGALICGEPGSGKSTFAQLCIDHGQKDEPWTLILDGLGGSFRVLTKKHNGAYFELDPDGKWPFTLNPFHSMEDNKKTRQYLTMLVRTCMATGGWKSDALAVQKLYTEVVRIMTGPKDDRRISSLVLPEKMAAYLAPWVGDGPYSFVFDNAIDTFSLNRFQTIDFSALMDFPELVQPLLFHFFYCWNRIVYDPKLLTVEKDMWIDEGWSMISYPAARRYIKAAGRTWRKRLGGLVLMTQSMVELKAANMLDLVNELCPLKLLLSNPGGNFPLYAETFQLNEKEVALYKGLREPGSGLYKSNRETKVFRTPIDPRAMWTYANSPYENAKRDKAIEECGSLDAALDDLAEGAA